jgi:hypothetical protein
VCSRGRARSARGCDRVFDYVGAGCSWRLTRESGFERAHDRPKRRGEERVHRRVRRSRARDAASDPTRSRTHRARRGCERVLITWVWVALGRHGEEGFRSRREERVHRRVRRSRARDAASDPTRSRRASRTALRARSLPRDPVTGTPVNTRLRTESMDSLRFSTARAATCSTHRDGFATAMCFARRRSLRRSRNAAIILPTTTVTPSLVRRPSFFDRFRKRRGGRHRSLGQRRLLRRTRSLRQHCPLSRARCHFAHRVGRRSLHTLSVVARFAHLPSRVSERYRGRDG